MSRSQLARSSVAQALAAVLLLGLLVVPAVPAAASPTYDAVIDLTFPVAGPTSFIDDYAYCRDGCSRRHRATDIMAPYGARVHAAMGGTVTYITGLTEALPAWGWMITIAGDDGRRYSYIHLGRQDRDWREAYVPGLARGSRVERGQHIGFNGCSGNASCSAPHLHLEIEDSRITDPYGSNRMNPYPSLLAALARGDIPGGADTAPSIHPPCTGEVHAVAGDWDGSGRDGMGWWCDGRVRLRTSGGRLIEFGYGRSGDIPVVGDWNGDGRDTFIVVRDGTWHVKNSLTSGAADHSFSYGRVTRGDVPISGDWNGSGRDTVGIIRGAEWHLRNSLSGGSADVMFAYGRLTQGDRPLIGDWNGSGADGIGILRDGVWHLRNSLAGGGADHAFAYGRVLAGDTPLVADWTGDRRSTPAIVRSGEWHLRYSLAGGAADRVVRFAHP
jgi:hypothetical protein